MNQTPTWEQALWTRKGEGTAAARALRSPLLALSGLYAAAVRARMRAYQKGWIGRHRVGAKVVVVGNLTVGGSGKTPLAEWIARQLLERGMRPALISRGYGGRSTGPLMVSDGEGPIESPELAGDEPVLMARRLKGVPVVAGSDRPRACEFAIDRFGATHLVLDDGFQHLALERDMDILVLDAGADPSREHLLPRGPLREPVEAAARAHALVFSRARRPEAPGWEWLERVCPDTPSFPMRYRPLGLTALGYKKIMSVGVPSLAFCAIGSPGSFFSTLEESGVEVVDRVVFRDHHAFSRAEIEELARRAEGKGARRLVTTEKDAVKIPPEWAASMPMDVLRIEPDFLGREERLVEAVLACLGEKGIAA